MFCLLLFFSLIRSNNIGICFLCSRAFVRNDKINRYIIMYVHFDECVGVRACVCAFINLTLHIKLMQVKEKLSANKNGIKRKTFSFVLVLFLFLVTYRRNITSNQNKV